MSSLLDVELVARLMAPWFGRPRAPTRLVMDLTRRCNLRCAMCHTWRVEPGHELTAGEVRAMLGQMPDLLWLDVTGGEVFLRADALELFDAVLDAAPSLKVLHFPTNGWFTRRVTEAARRVRERRPDLALIVTVSIDGPPALHDRIRGREGSFARAMETWRALRAVPGVDVYLGTTITPDNRAHLDALEASLRAEVPDFHPRLWHWNWLQISEHFFANGHLAGQEGAPAEAGSLVREHLQRRGLPRTAVELMELVFLVNLDAYRRGEPSGVPCQAMHSAAFLSPEGKLYPCHVWDRPLGDLRTQSVDAVWNAPATLQARRDVVERLACGGCFTPCEAYPALAGAPAHTVAQTFRRSLALLPSVLRAALR
jgi:MoaA/NifB/PqqE/SkfB family radical SAM enzyme